MSENEKEELDALWSGILAVVQLHERSRTLDFCLHCQTMTDGHWPCETIEILTRAMGLDPSVAGDWSDMTDPSACDVCGRDPLWGHRPNCSRLKEDVNG